MLLMLMMDCEVDDDADGADGADDSGRGGSDVRRCC